MKHILSSHLLSKNEKFKVYSILIPSVVLYGCKSLAVMYNKEHSLRVFKSKVLRKLFVCKMKELTGG
jgi:hypothetical protein